MSRKDPQLNIRLPQSLKDKVTAIANENKRSVNAEVVKMLESCVAQHYFFLDSEGYGHYSFEDVTDSLNEDEVEMMMKIDKGIAEFKAALISTFRTKPKNNDSD
ncbi:Arc family DNA-binding protein [Shewanella bicestrii]